MGFGGLGMWEILLILLVLLLVFGARRLPELGGSLGKGIREFKKSVREIEGELRTTDTRRELNGPPQNQTTAPPPPAETAKTGEKTDA